MLDFSDSQPLRSMATCSDVWMVIKALFRRSEKKGMFFLRARGGGLLWGPSLLAYLHLRIDPYCTCGPLLVFFLNSAFPELSMLPSTCHCKYLCWSQSSCIGWKPLHYLNANGLRPAVSIHDLTQCYERNGTATAVFVLSWQSVEIMGGRLLGWCKYTVWCCLILKNTCIPLFNKKVHRKKIK